MVVSKHDSIEFVVSESAFVSLKEKQKHVEGLFDVCVTASDNVGELRWVKVNGGEKPRKKAKEYITSLGKPEVEQVISVGQSFIEQQTEWNLADYLFELEKESSANITLVNEDKVRVAGSASSVEYVVSSIVSSTSNQGGNVLMPDLPIKRARLGSTSTLDENDSAIGEELSDSLEAVETLIGSLQQENDVCTRNDRMANAMKFDDDGLVMNALPETSQDFAEKLGYSKELYAMAERKLGKGADRNALLNELVKLKNSAKELNEERYNDPPKIERRRNSCSMINTSPKPLRPIIIDGSNVAMSHGKQKVFSCKGIALAVDWFKRRGHKSIYVVIPTWRKESPSEQNPMTDQEILRNLDDEGHVIYTPSRTVGGKRIACYDDRYIIKVACDKDGVIVSNDNFRDLQREQVEWKKFVEERLLMYSFVDDAFMPPDDPHGRHGPTIDELLTVGGSGTKSKVCQYGRYCTYGRHCKYAHPERDLQPGGETVLRDSPSNCPRPYSEPVPITDNFCEEFKRVLSMPNLHGSQSQTVGGYPMHSSQLPPALPQRHPHAAPPPIPPRNNNIMTRGMMTSNESPYAPLPGGVMGLEHPPPPVMQARRQPRAPPRQHADYDALPLPLPRGHLPPTIPHHAGNGRYHHYTNIPNAVYISNGQRRRGGPYDNIPPPGGQIPVYPNHNPAGVCPHNYYRGRAPPAEDTDEDEKPSLPSRARHSSETKTLTQCDIDKLMAYAKKLDETKKSEHLKNKKVGRDSGNDNNGRRAVFNLA